MQHIHDKERRGEATQLVTMHPNERDRRYGDFQRYLPTSPAYIAQGADLKKSIEYRQQRDSDKEKKRGAQKPQLEKEAPEDRRNLWSDSWRSSGSAGSAGPAPKKGKKNVVVRL